MNVLLVEDNPGDVRLTLEVFREANPSVQLHVANDGTEALAFLRRQGLYSQSPRPHMIMLDLNMPKMDGRELLAIIKKDASLKLIPTIILTSSGAQEDIQAGYALQANSYLKKPADYAEFKALVESISRYWLTRVTLPQPDFFDQTLEESGARN
jgi:chemotaxis family two-component system response regulator Rcp1